MKKKTLVIIYLNLGIGGIQKRIRDFVFEISQHHKDWNVYILLRRKTKEGFDSQIKTGDRIVLLYYPFTNRIRMPFGFIFWIGWQIIRLRPNVILTFLHALSAVVIIVKRLLFWIPSKIVLNEGIVTSRHLSINHALFYSFLVKLTYPWADVIIVPTRACKEDLIKQYSLSAENIIIIPNWTCLPPQRPISPTFDCLYIGRFHQEKSPLQMVCITNTLVTHNPTIHVGMMGSGELLHGLNEAIKSANLSRNIRILPFSQHIADVLRRSKVLVVPSFVEGMPNVVLEAAMCGVPSVVNHFPGAEEVVCHGKTGYISETTTDAATYIDYLLRHEQKRKRMGIAAQRYVAEHFSRVTQKCFIETLVS